MALVISIVIEFILFIAIICIKNNANTASFQIVGSKQSYYNILKEVALVNLLLDIDNIDYKKTALNVQDFLDHKLPHILRLANESPASLKSPVISDMPINHDGSNHNEDKIIKYIAAKNLINGVAKAFQSCSKTSYQILKSKYIDGLQDWQVEQLMYCSHSTYYKLRNKAYNEFADCFELQKGCKDLHAYLIEKSV